ncbi:unnamed protein product [Coregonus sp. 'balchen']|nr:unnamed protein product [Coregonus sp. 'balchen']
MMPSSDQLHESQPSEAQSQENIALKQVPRDRPVVQALWHVALRGAEALCKALIGSEREGSDEGMLQQDSISEEMYFPCYESSVSLERSISVGDTDVRMYPNSWRPYLPESEDDAFINIKLSAIRQAFESSEGFGLVWEKLMAFTENPTNWPGIVDECQEAGVLEYQEHIPAILKPTLRTPWISEGTKKTTVMFYAWSQIKKKRECLMRPDGLYHHLYEVFDYTDPEIILDIKRYESPESLAVKVLSNWKGLVRFLQFYVDENQYSLLISMNHKERGISV